jgi:hypothetical protein
LTFAPKRDRWLSIVIWLSAVVLFLCGLTPIIVGGISFIGGLLIFMLCQTCAAFTVWLWIGISYTLSNHHLIIKCGPIRNTIAYDSIVHAKPIRSWLASMATSSQRIEIKFGKFGFVHISPLLEETFMSELKLRCPQL